MAIINSKSLNEVVYLTTQIFEGEVAVNLFNVWEEMWDKSKLEDLINLSRFQDLPENS